MKWTRADEIISQFRSGVGIEWSDVETVFDIMDPPESAENCQLPDDVRAVVVVLEARVQKLTDGLDAITDITASCSTCQPCVRAVRMGMARTAKPVLGPTFEQLDETHDETTWVRVCRAELARRLALKSKENK